MKKNKRFLFIVIIFSAFFLGCIFGFWRSGKDDVHLRLQVTNQANARKLLNILRLIDKENVKQARNEIVQMLDVTILDLTIYADRYPDTITPGILDKIAQYYEKYPPPKGRVLGGHVKKRLKRTKRGQSLNLDVSD